LGDIAAKDVDEDGDVASSLSEISTPAEPDRSGRSQAGGNAASGSAEGKTRRQPK
jgi:hypothetical protein